MEDHACGELNFRLVAGVHILTLGDSTIPSDGASVSKGTVELAGLLAAVGRSTTEGLYQ